MLPTVNLKAQAWYRCDRKRAYHSRKKAELAARATSKKYKRCYEVYSCYECGLLHVGRHPHPETLGPLCVICFIQIHEDRIKKNLTTCSKRCQKELNATQQTTHIGFASN